LVYGHWLDSNIFGCQHSNLPFWVGGRIIGDHRF
jgi:hypothetical protein